MTLVPKSSWLLKQLYQMQGWQDSQDWPTALLQYPEATLPNCKAVRAAYAAQAWQQVNLRRRGTVEVHVLQKTASLV